MSFTLFSCDDDDSNEYPNLKTVASAEEFVGAVEDGADIYVPEGKVIDMSGKSLSVNKDIEVRVDGTVKNLSGYVTVNAALTLTGDGRIECTGQGGFYINMGGRFNASDVTITYVHPANLFFGCTLYVNGGKVLLDDVTLTSTNQCIFSSQVYHGSMVHAKDCDFLSTATQNNCCYCIEAPGHMIATYEDCEISSFYGGVITESPNASITLSNTEVAVYKPSNSSYNADCAVNADAGGTIKLTNNSHLYCEGAYVAIENNSLGEKGHLNIEMCYANAKAYNVPEHKDVDPAAGKVWSSCSTDEDFLYPDGSERICKMLWYTANK